MKEHIYTIPVTDAFRGKTECPFCFMRDELEKGELNFVLGPSYMDDSVRRQTNEKGFCPEHFRKLYAGKNRLGLALMTHTHFSRVNKKVSGLIANGGIKKGLFSKPDKNTKLSEYIGTLNRSCYICDKIGQTFELYIETFFHLWGQGGEIRDLFAESSGFCLPHLAVLMNSAAEKLDPRGCSGFYGSLSEVQNRSMERIEGELDWFTKKFDYRYKDEPWNNSKDALPRAIRKLTSDCPDR